jgi:hypothetical protein
MTVVNGANVTMVDEPGGKVLAGKAKMHGGTQWRVGLYVPSCPGATLTMSILLGPTPGTQRLTSVVYPAWVSVCNITSP